MTRSYCSSVVSSTDVRVSMPALFTMMSRRPNASTVAATSISQVGDLADVGLDPDGLVAEGVHLLLQLLGGLRVGDEVDDDVRPRLGEREDDGLADAAVAARDDRHFPVQAHVSAPSSRGADGPVVGSGGSGATAVGGPTTRRRKTKYDQPW